MRNLSRDLRIAVRGLLRDPAFTVVAVLALALGIGANSAVFSVVDALLNFPLPIGDPNRTVFVWPTNEEQAISQSPVSIDEYLDWRDRAGSFRDMAAVVPTAFNVAGPTTPVRVKGARTTAGLFALADLPLTEGRAFLPEDNEPGAPKVVIVGYGFWQQQLGGGRILGDSLLLDGERHTIVGIAPRSFFFPDPDSTMFVPLELERGAATRDQRVAIVVAGLVEGVDIETADAEMQTIADSVQMAHPETNGGWSARVVSLRDDLREGSYLAIGLLYGSITFVLLIACSNVASLLLARGSRREREMALRVSLGAGRARLLGQLLTESVVLAVIGGSLGLVGASWAIGAIRTMIAPDPSIGFLAEVIALDRTILLYTLGLTLLTGGIFGLLPALQLSKSGVHGGLREGGRGTGAGRGKQRLLALLVCGQVAMALGLLGTAGALIRSVDSLYQRDPGFDSSSLLTLQIALPEGDYPHAEDLRAFHDRSLRALRAIPGVEAVASSKWLPLTLSPRTRTAQIEIEGDEVAGEDWAPDALHEVVSPGFFETYGVAVLQGRALRESDRPGSLPVAVVSRALAERYWPQQSPLDRRLRLVIPGVEARWLTVVGVCDDLQLEGHSIRFDTPAVPTVFLPFDQDPQRVEMLALRARVEPEALIQSVRGTIRDLDPLLPVLDAQSMATVIARRDAQNRFFLRVLTALSAIALLLAGTGIYGMISFAVAGRKKEIGIRMALGASPASVVTLAVGRAAVMTVLGGVVGLGLAFTFVRVLSSQLEGVASGGGDGPLTFAAVALTLMVVAQIASFVPARRAVKVDPMVTLREE